MASLEETILFLGRSDGTASLFLGRSDGTDLAVVIWTRFDGNRFPSQLRNNSTENFYPTTFEELIVHSCPSVGWNGVPAFLSCWPIQCENYVLSDDNNCEF